MAFQGCLAAESRNRTLMSLPISGTELIVTLHGFRPFAGPRQQKRLENSQIVDNFHLKCAAHPPRYFSDKILNKARPLGEQNFNVTAVCG